MQQSGSCPRGPFCAFAHVESECPDYIFKLFFTFTERLFSLFSLHFYSLLPEPFVPEEPSFPTPSSPPPPRPPDPLPPQEASSSSPSRHNMGPGSSLGSVSDPFTPSTGSYVAKQGLLGGVLSLCEDVSGGAEPPSPWAGEGGYCRAPGFEREDQVRGLLPQQGMNHGFTFFVDFISNLLFDATINTTHFYPHPLFTFPLHHHSLWFQAKQRSFALEQRSRELSSTQSKQVKSHPQTELTSVFFPA